MQQDQFKESTTNKTLWITKILVYKLNLTYKTYKKLTKNNKKNGIF